MYMKALITICLLLVVPGQAENADEEGAVEVEDAEGVLQQLDEALDSGIISEAELTHTLKNTFKISEKDWRILVEQHDADGDGNLAADELLSVAEYLTNKHGEWPIDERKPLTGPWIGIYASMGVIVLYVLYAGWKHRQENARVVHGPSDEQLREARLAVLAGIRATAGAGERSNTERNKGGSTGDTQKPNEHKHNSSLSELRRRPLKDKNQSSKNKDFNSASKSETSNVGDQKDSAPNRNKPTSEKCNSSQPNADNNCGSSTPVDNNSASIVSEEAKAVMKSSSKPGPHPDLSGEELYLYVLSKIFNLKVEIPNPGAKTGWVPGTMSIKATDIPTKPEDARMKMFVLFERRLARHYASKVKLCVSCYYSCQDLKGVYKNDTIDNMLSSTITMCVSTILQELQQEEEEANDEDDLYSGVSQTSESTEKLEIVSFLTRVAGWSDDGVNISSDLLNEITSHAANSDQTVGAMAKVIRSAGNVFKSVQRLDELQLTHGKTLKGLEHLLSQPAMPELLSKILDKEIEQATTSLGVYFEKESALGTLLSITTIPRSLVEATKLNSPALQPWVSLRGFPQRPNHDEIRNLESRMQDQLHIIQQLLFNVLKRMMKSHKEVALSWLAAMISMNEMRTTVTPQIQPVANNNIQAACSDGFMLNVCAILVELCLPFCKGDVTKLDKIDASYSASSACRLNYDFETCLAGGQIVQEGNERSSSSGRIPETLQGKYNFMTEILHLTLRVLNIGFLPAKIHFRKLQQQLLHTLKAVSGNKSAEEDMKAKHLAFSLQWDAHLLDPDMLRKGSEFYLTVAMWLQLQLENSVKGTNNEAEAEKKQRKIFSQIPEHVVKDMAQWFWFLASHGLLVHQRALVGLQLVPFVDVCVYLLRRPDLVPGPIPAYRITQALLAFVTTNNRNAAHQQGWGSGVISELAAMVHACPTVQEHLGPALLHTYISVDVVEGLDVDKEDFDKYGARAEIARLLQNLWQRLDCRSSVLKLCGSEKFQSFLGAIIDTLLYQLHDSLARLANVRKLERNREDETAWNALSAKERDASESFLKNEERVATGFMSMARDTLGLIDLISKSEEVARCFTIMPLAKRAASTFIGFLESLCGAKSADFKVKDMEKYNFNPRELLSQIVQILLRIVHEERSKELHFVKSLSSDPDYNPVTIQKACDILRSRNIMEENAVKEFETINEEVSLLREAVSTDSSASTSGVKDDWQSEIENTKLNGDELETTYTEEMGDLRFDSADLQDNHCYLSNANHPLDVGSRQTKALIKEMKQWSEILPVHPHAAVFVRQDEERMDMVRALITGPKDTPYSLGCFLFDVYFPSQYPNIPPLVKFLTTGGGTVRFNPNLYADGKVCLSLLGTFYSGDSSQKWQPNTSSLYQVMVSIQSMILIPDPMYNEPGYEGMRDTQEGEARSREYNAKLRLMTVRHAMLGQLRHPPIGFEDVIRRHFILQEKVLLKQCAQWLQESMDEDEEKKLRRVVDELRSELKKLSDSDKNDNN